MAAIRFPPVGVPIAGQDLSTPVWKQWFIEFVNSINSSSGGGGGGGGGGGSGGGAYLLFATAATVLTNVVIPGFNKNVGRLDITSTANLTVNSIAGGTDGQELTIRNANAKGGPFMTFPVSTATNGFDASGTVTLAPRQKFEVCFYGTESRWV